MAKKCRLSDEEKRKIKKSWENNNSINEIADALDRTPRFVQTYLESELNICDFEEDLQENDVEMVNEDTKEQKESLSPHYTDVKWSSYVLSLFSKDELQKGNPTVDGLRRVAHLVIGDIEKIDSQILQLPIPENQRRATVKVTVVFNSGQSFSGLADSYNGNTDGPYSIFPVAVAETRAEGRALRKALGLKRVVAAEELSDKMPTEEDEFINESQINFLNVMCGISKLNIDIRKLIAKEIGPVKTIETIAYDSAVSLIEKLQTYQNNKGEIPKDILGYSADWKG